MQELKELADSVKAKLGITYDQKGVKFLEGFIERNKEHFPPEEWEGLINSCAAFLGQTIIEAYGGQWEQQEEGEWAVAFDAGNKVYPFAKVSKQFHNGLEDSIYSMYTVIPMVFNLQLKPKKKWWQF